MSRATRNHSVTASATLMTLSLAICLGAVAETSLATAHRSAEPTPRSALTANQREALASLLAQLTDAAREFHGAPNHAPMTAPPRALTAALSVRLHAHPGPDRPRRLPTPPLRAALLNLPPPVQA